VDVVDVVEVAALTARRSRTSVRIREAVDFDRFPSPACSHNDATSRIGRPRTNAPITIARSGALRGTFVPRVNSVGTNGSAA
jgi:hypothetical protein